MRDAEEVSRGGIGEPPSLPCPFPDAERIAGRAVALERLDPARHADGLWCAIGADAALWAQIPPGPFEAKAEFGDWLAARAERADTALYTIVDEQGEPAGLFFLLRIDPAMGVLEMGLVYGPALARQTAGTEAFLLLADYVFAQLGYRRLEWRCNDDHAVSRRAAERFGFTLEGVLRQTMWMKGRSRNTALYAILDGDWPDVRGRIAAWLEADNFLPDGSQRRALRPAGQDGG
jgi:RimJ/RimL family protein N-acetyltransferase